MKLSIIIPVYNVEKYLSKCLDSVIYPAHEDYEVIIVNDGSTDSSPAIAQEYVDRHSDFIKLITTENGGLGAARNVGLEAAKGDFLLFLDSDDWLCENAVPEILDKLTEDFDICIYGILSVTEDGTILDDVKSCQREGNVTLRDFPQLLLSPPSGCNKLCRRTLFTQSGLRFPSRVWYEDLRTMPKLYLLTDKIIATDTQWYRYLRRSGSIINSANLQRNLEIIDAFEDLAAYYKQMGKYDEYYSELEYIAYFNRFLTASVRVCQADPKSPVLDTLVEGFLAEFPCFRQNKYVQQSPKKYKLLTYLIAHKHYRAVKLIMDMNDRSKHK